MPTYEYRCRACGHEFERFQKISDPPLKTCPACGKRRVERLISAGGGLVFKGPGFYATDYRKGGPSGTEGGSGAGSPGKTEGGAGEKEGADGTGKGPADTGKKGDA